MQPIQMPQPAPDLTIFPFRNVMLVGYGGKLSKGIKSEFDIGTAFTISYLLQTDHAGVKQPTERVFFVTSDYPVSKLIDIFHGQDALIITIRLPFEQTKHIIDAAIEAGVRRVIPPEYGLNTSPLALRIPEYAENIKTLNYLRDNEDKISWTIIHTGPVLEWYLAGDYYGFDLKRNWAKIYNSGNNRFSMTSLARASQAVVEVLEDPWSTKNREIYVHSFTKSQRDISKALSKIDITLTHQEVKLSDERAKAESENNVFEIKRLSLLRLLYSDDGDHRTDFTKGVPPGGILLKNSSREQLGRAMKRFLADHEWKDVSDGNVALSAGSAVGRLL